MGKRKNRLCAWLLTAAILLSMVPASVFAEAVEPTKAAEAQSQTAQKGTNAEVKCSCEALCNKDAVKKDCPLCGAEKADLTKVCKGAETAKDAKAVEATEAAEATKATEATEATEAVETEPAAAEESQEADKLAAFQAQIDALPTVEEFQAMEEEAQQATILAAQAIADAYEALTEEEQGKLDIASLEALFASINAEISVLTEPEHGLSAADPMMVSGEALAYDVNKGIVGFSQTWYNNLNLNGSTLYVALTVPAEINGQPVQKIAYQALQYKHNGFRREPDVLKDELQKIKIVSVDFTQATNLTEIGQFAFDQRGELSGVLDLSNTKVTVIGAGSFRGSSLSGAILPDGLRELGDVDSGAGVFAQCTSLNYVRKASARDSGAAVVLPEGLTTIGKQCFRYSFPKGCRVEITIPASVSTIGAEAFNATGGNSGEICQLKIMRTSDFSGYDKYAFQSKTVYPAIYSSMSAYQEAKKSNIRDGNGSATMTFLTDVHFIYNGTELETQQKLYNFALYYEKDAQGFWCDHSDSFRLPIPDSISAGMMPNWMFQISGKSVTVESKPLDTEPAESVTVVADKTILASPEIEDAVITPNPLHEEQAAVVSLKLPQLPEGIQYAYEWIMYDESYPDSQRPMGTGSTLTLSYEEAKGNYFAVGVNTYLLSDESVVSEQAVYGWFTVRTTAHIWPDTWTIDRQPTGEQDGLRHKTCTVQGCGKTIYETFVDPENPGKITKAVEIGSGAPNTDMLNTREELALLLNEEEQAAVDSGSHARIWLEVTRPGNLPESDTQAIEEKAAAVMGKGVSFHYFDISLYTKTETTQQRKLSQTEQPIRMVLTVPEEVRVGVSEGSRSWQLFRVHDGVAEAVSGQYNADTGEMAIEANRFSTYGFAYKDSYTVSFDKNGGEGATPDAITVDNGQSFSVPGAEKLYRDGYHFLGWAKDNKAVQADYVPGIEVEALDRNMVLYAVWMPNTYRVVFHANGGQGAMEDQTLSYDAEETALTANAFIRDGYTFNGWAQSEQGQAAFRDCQPVQNLTRGQDGIVDLYAVWAYVPFQVKLDAQGGFATDSTIVTKEGNVLSKTPETPRAAGDRAGYHFSGWFTEAKAGQAVTEATVFARPAEGGEAPTIYAHWYVNVAFDPNGGTGETATTQTDMDDHLLTLPKTPSRDQYRFDGWYTEKDGGTKVTVDSSAKFTQDTILYARWSYVPVTVTFNPDGGTVTPKTMQTVEGGKLEKKIPTPTRSGYRFQGWYDEQNQMVDDDTIYTSNTTLTAHWKRTVSLTGNPSTGDQAPIGLAAAVLALAAAGLIALVVVKKRKK